MQTEIYLTKDMSNPEDSHIMNIFVYLHRSYYSFSLLISRETKIIRIQEVEDRDIFWMTRR